MLIALALALTVSTEASLPPLFASEALERAAPQLATLPEVTLLAYEVAGRSGRDVRTQLNLVRPVDDEGKSSDALTSWRYNARWPTVNGRCDPSQSQVDVEIRVVLPQLSAQARLSHRDRARWDRYYEALIRHEAQHVEIVRSGMDRLRAKLVVEDDCLPLRAISEAEAYEINLHNWQYDDLTQHGLLEGATFP